jgi:hypothetical protein
LIHDDDVEVYLNGQRVARLEGILRRYIHVPIDDPALLRPGTNVLAAHCRNIERIGILDVGLVEEIEPIR